VDFGARKSHENRLSVKRYEIPRRVTKTVGLVIQKWILVPSHGKRLLGRTKVGLVPERVTKTVCLSVQKRILLPQRVTKTVCLSEKVDIGAEERHKNRLLEHAKVDFGVRELQKPSGHTIQK
jgi:hypothetical protein